MGAELMGLLKRLGPEGAALLEKLKGGAMKAGDMAMKNPGTVGAGALGAAGGMSLAKLMGDDDDEDHLGI